MSTPLHQGSLQPSAPPVPGRLSKKFSIESIRRHFEERSYNAEQMAFITSPLESATLRGIPGGGKTASIIGKIIYHFLRRDLTGTHHFKLFTFSKRACSDFIEKGKRYHPRIFQKSNIMTLHSLAGKILYKTMEKKSSSKNSVIMSALHIFDKALREGGSPSPSPSPLREFLPLSECKIIFVDEAQDISDIQYDLIMKISAYYGIPVMMIGDPNQNIYQFQNGSDKFLLEHKGPRYDLIQNYRSTPAIVNFVNEMRPWGSLTPRMVSARGGTGSRPQIIVETIPHIIDHVIHSLRTTSTPLHEIAIIGPVKKCKPIGGFYTNIGLSLFTNLLKEAGIPYVKHYEDGSDGDGGSGGDIDREIHYKEGHVNLFTIHGSKGLEFKTVHLLNFHHHSFGIQPTEEDYNAFKYLWYVGVSRAMDELYLYIDERKNAWYELKMVPLECVEYKTRFPKHIPKLEYREELRPLVYPVTDLLKQKKYMNDTLYHYWYEAIGERSLEKFPLWEGHPAPEITYEVSDRDTLKLYGIFMENIFNYGYHRRKRVLPDFAVKAESMIVNTVEIPRKYMRGYGILRARLPEVVKECVTLSRIYAFKHLWTLSESELFGYLSGVCGEDYHREMFLMPQNDVISYPRDRILEKIAILRDLVEEGHAPSPMAYEAIYDLSIFAYQREHECAYLWRAPVDEHLTRLAPHIEYLIAFTWELSGKREESDPEYLFHPKRMHPNLPIVGEMDMLFETEDATKIDDSPLPGIAATFHRKVDDSPLPGIAATFHRKVVELKYSQSSGMEAHIDQVLMYWMLVDPTLSETIELEIWNIAKGERHVLRVDPERIYKVQWLQVLCKAIGQKLKNMVFLCEVESTSGYYAHHSGDIIDRYVMDLESRSVWSRGLVRPKGLSFIPFEITRAKGITKELIEAEGETFEEMEAEFQNIFRYCEMPLFLLRGENGNGNLLLFQRGLLREGECKTLSLQPVLRLFGGALQGGESLRVEEEAKRVIQTLESFSVTIYDLIKMVS